MDNIRENTIYYNPPKGGEEEDGKHQAAPAINLLPSLPTFLISCGWALLIIVHLT